LTVEAAIDETCAASFSYDATPSGGSDPDSVTFAWEFSGGGTTTPDSSTTKSGSVSVGTTNVSYTGTVTVTDARTDILCTAEDSDDGTPLSPLAINLELTDGGATCPGISSSAVEYTAHPSGGNGDYSITWVGVTCAGLLCEVSDPGLCASETFHAEVSDSSGLCDDQSSEEETYTKTTTVNGTDN
jgi:hypothetical protein